MRKGEYGEDRPGGEPDEPLTVESLDLGRPERLASRGVRLRAWLGALEPAWSGRRLSIRARTLRAGLVVILVAATLFALLGGPALVGAGWARLYGTLTGADMARPLAMTPWRTVPPAPFAPQALVSYAPDPSNPQRVFACAPEGSADVAVWVTDSGGHAWREILVVPLPQAASASCQVKIAVDAPVVALLLVRARGVNAAGCDALSVYGLTDLGSGQLMLPNTPAACLGDVWPSAASLYYWWTNNQGAQALTGLERSDDLGATWHEVSLIPPDQRYSLAPAVLASGSGDTLMTQVYEWGAAQQDARVEVWRSLDGGNTWRRATNAPLGAQALTTTEPGALTNPKWPPTYAAAFNGGELSPPWPPGEAPATIQALQPDGSTWRALPPLPLQASPSPPLTAPLGVSVALAVGPGGDLLALGQRPGTAATLNPQPHQWLWAWDPAARLWRDGLEAPDGAALAGVTWANGPASSRYARSPGAYLWLTSDRDGQSSLSWTFIPAAQKN